MSNHDDALNTILASDRPTAQRIALLHDLREELRGEKAVQTLLAAAREEKTLELRRAFFEHAASSDITRISDRETFINGILHFATIEEEAPLRRTALTRLGEWTAHSPVIEDVLLETLISDLEIETQWICAQGLSNCVAERPENTQRLLKFIPQSPAQLRAALIGLLTRYDVKSVQSGLALLLDPAESPDLRARALQGLASLPQLEPATLAALKSYVLSETDPNLQAYAVAILRDCKQVDPELFKIIFELFTRYPDRADLISAIEYRLASFPDLLPTLSEMFPKIRSAQLRVRILKTLEKTPLVPLFIAALKDSSPQVRRAAVECCAHHQSRNAEEIERAVLDAARNENIVSVREAMAKLFTSRVRRTDAANNELIAWLVRETEPRVERVLVHALPAIPLSGENGRTILNIWRKMLTDPATDAYTRAMIVDQLANAAYMDAPEIAECLRILLQQSTEISEVETLYDRLRELSPDVHAHADLILSLFFRFAGDYPRDPLTDWLKEFEVLAPSNPQIRKQIPYIVRLTGASWLSGSAETADRKAILLPALMEQIRQNNWIEAGRLLRESWESRTIRKSDMLLFFKKLLRMPGEEGLMQSSLVMMAKGGLVTPEVMDLGFNYLREHPRSGSYTSLITDFLQGKNQDHSPMRSIDEVRVDLEPARQKDPNYRERVFSEFTQRNYSRFWRATPEPMDLPPQPRDWSEWEYQLWPDKGCDWCIARMFFALKPFDRISTMLASPPDAAEPRTHSIHYLLLLHLWQELYDNLPATVLDEVLRGVGTLIRNTSGKRGFAVLHDRAVLVFQKYWTRQINSPAGGRNVSAELSAMAAEVYTELCKISAGFDTEPARKFPAAFPDLLQGLDHKRLESLWPGDRASWERLYKEHFEGAEDDAKARALYEKATQLEAAAKFEDAFAVYQELLTTFVNTRVVKRMRSTLEYSRADCDPSKPSSPGEEQGAKTQYDFLQTQAQGPKPEQAIRTLDRLLKRYWRTEFLKNKRDELVALKAQLSAKISGT